MDETSRPLFTHLLTITDPRRDASTDHSMKSILFIAVCAVICGADGWTGVARCNGPVSIERVRPVN